MASSLDLFTEVPNLKGINLHGKYVPTVVIGGISSSTVILSSAALDSSMKVMVLSGAALSGTIATVGVPYLVVGL